MSKSAAKPQPRGSKLGKNQHSMKTASRHHVQGDPARSWTRQTIIKSSIVHKDTFYETKPLAKVHNKTHHLAHLSHTC